MSTNPQVQQHPASVDAYIRHGWSLVPIPHGTKGPTTPGWNRKENTLTVHAQLPQGFGIGLAHAYSGTMALDVDVWDRAVQELSSRGIDLQALYDAPDAVVIDSGRQGHGKLLYAMPMGIPLQSKKLIDTRTNEAGEDERYNYLDFRCATANGLTVQDVLPPSIHPDTNQPYRWAGRGHWTRLPVIPDTLLRFWSDLIAADSERTLPSGIGVNASWDEIRGALEFISPDCSRDEWVTVGMALHFAGTSTGQVNDALHLWDEWSQPSAKYPGDRAMLVQWNSFRPDKANSVRLGSLFRLATRGGWTKPEPDVSTLFQSTEVKTPMQVTTDMRPPPPDLDLDLFPEILRRRALEISDSVGCDPLVPLFAGLAAVSGVIDARTRIELMPGFKVPPVLWLMTIGDPADKKSPGSRPMFSILSQLEIEDKPRYNQAMQVYEALEARHEASKKAFLDAAKDIHGMLAGEVPQGYGDAPVPPVSLKIVVQDITSQKLVRHAAERPRGLLCHLDEMHSWSEKVSDPRSGEDRSSWVLAYECERYEMDRVGAGTISAENFAVSIFGNMQPQVFSRAAAALAKDGLLQRFIPVVLRHDRTRLGNPIPEELSSAPQYNQMVRLVHGLPAMTYRLDSAAHIVFREFQQWYETAKQDERVLRSGSVFMTAFGKIEGLVGRLILLWHVMLEPYSSQVGAGTVRQVVEFARSYLIPAMRYAYDSDLGGVSSFDQWIAEHVIQYADKTELTLSGIKQAGRRQTPNLSPYVVDQMVLGAMYPLEQAGWVIRTDDGEGLRRHHASWAVNPQLATMFEDHRKAVIAAKQRQMDHIFRDATKRKPRVHGFEGTIQGEQS